jgi:ligand-binding sensor domain-containing protein
MSIGQTAWRASGAHRRLTGIPCVSSLWLRLRPLLVILLISAASPLFGAEKTLSSEFLLRGWDSEDGLPAGRVQAVTQTRDGYLWVGTSRGLARFDGARFVVLTTNNTPELGDDRIASLLVARSGDLWVGTVGGFLARRRAGVFEAVPLTSGQARRKINTLAEAEDGGVWIGTTGTSLARWRPGSCEWFNLPGGNSPAENEVTQVLTDSEGRAWAVAGGKLVKFQDGSWQLAAGTNTFGSDQVVALASAREGGIWLAACAAQGEQGLKGRGTQLFKLGRDGWSEHPGHYPWPQDTIFSRTTRLLEDRSGRLWVATVGVGVFTWTDTAGWQPLVAAGQSSLVESSSLAEGQEGAVWIGTTDFQLF